MFLAEKSRNQTEKDKKGEKHLLRSNYRQNPDEHAELLCYYLPIWSGDSIQKR